MKGFGNGRPQVCVQNLLQITRGECPFERVKGLDPRLRDKPIQAVEPEVKQDAHWLLETYEPRVTVSGINVALSDGNNGGFIVTADVEDSGGRQ